MKRLLPVGVALALCLSYASAQNITKSLQGSQDPRGPVGLDTSNSAYFPGHINAFGQTPATSVTICGAGGVLAANSNDVAGQVTVGAVTACSVLFGEQFNAAPFCMAVVNSAAAAVGSNATSVLVTTRTTGFNLTQASSGDVINYLCLGGLGG